MWAEDPLYEEWRLADEGQRPELEQKIFAAVTEHVEIVVWRRLKENNRELIDDIREDVVLGLRKFRQRANFSTWVDRIAQNKVYKEIRRRSQQRNSLGYRTELFDRKGEERLGKKAPDHAARADTEHRIERLHPKEATLLRLKCEGRTDAEVAAMPGDPRGQR